MTLLRCGCLLEMVLALGGVGGAAEVSPALKPYGALYKEWKGEVAELDAVVPEHSRAEKRSKRLEINARYMPRFLKLAQETADDELWIQCLVWTSVEGTPGKEMDAMFDLLRERANDVADDVQLMLLMSNYIPMQSDRIDPALSHIVETHRFKAMRGAALYVLAARTKRVAEEQGDVKGCVAAEKMLERVVAEYPDAQTYSGKNLERGTALLVELRSPVALGKTAPETAGKTISGEGFSLREAIRRKVAVISFSGHWCGPCVAMHPVKKEILSTFSRDQVVIVEMNSDSRDALDKVRGKIAADGMTWIVVSDGSDGPIAHDWRIRTWPTYFVIDSEGKIRRRVSGNLGRRLATYVDELVPKTSGAP